MLTDFVKIKSETTTSKFFMYKKRISPGIYVGHGNLSFSIQNLKDEYPDFKDRSSCGIADNIHQIIEFYPELAGEKKILHRTQRNNRRKRNKLSY